MKPTEYVKAEDRDLEQDRNITRFIAGILEDNGFEIRTLNVDEFRPTDVNGNKYNYRQLDIRIESLCVDLITGQPTKGWPV